MLTYPHINPIAVSIGPIFGLGPLRVHWYGIMYLIGFVAAWWLARYRARRPGSTWTTLDIDDLIFYCAIGVIVGGRLGWCIVYGHDVIAESWLNVFHIWDGGMAFHGGLTGVIIATLVFARVKHKNFADVMDFVAPLPGIGLMAGRIGNFINGELWGKPGSVSWAMIFPNARSADVDWATTHPQWQAVLTQFGGLPRHPSQLYEMLLEGVVMFTVLFVVSIKPRPRYLISGLFALLYGCFRFGVEFVRVPDPQLGYLAWGWLTMGQIQSLPLVLIGLVLIAMSRNAPTMRPYNVSLPTKE